MSLTNLQKLRLSVADREKIKVNEIIGEGDGTRSRWVLRMHPIKNDTDAVHAAITLPISGTTAVTTSITSPSISQIATVTGNASGITGNVVIAGTDSSDEAATDTIVASGTSTVNGDQEFKTITSITVPVRTQSGDKISVGLNSTIITVNDVEKTPGTDYSLNFETGLLSFLTGKTPSDGHMIKALTYSYYAFSDDELNSILSDESSNIIASWARCLRILASSAAKFFIYWSGDEKVDKSKVSANFLRIAENLEIKMKSIPASEFEWWKIEEEEFGNIMEELDLTTYLST